MTAARKRREDIPKIFGELADDVLLDRRQTGEVVGAAPPTLQRWDREETWIPTVMLNGRPRYRVGDLRAWLGGEPTARRNRPAPSSSDAANATPAR
jgi:hypothetical protein